MDGNYARHQSDHALGLGKSSAKLESPPRGRAGGALCAEFQEEGAITAMEPQETRVSRRCLANQAVGVHHRQGALAVLGGESRPCSGNRLDPAGSTTSAILTSIRSRQLTS